MFISFTFTEKFLPCSWAVLSSGTLDTQVPPSVPVTGRFEGVVTVVSAEVGSSVGVGGTGVLVGVGASVGVLVGRAISVRVCWTATVWAIIVFTLAISGVGVVVAHALTNNRTNITANNDKLRICFVFIYSPTTKSWVVIYCR